MLQRAAAAWEEGCFDANNVPAMEHAACPGSRRCDQEGGPVEAQLTATVAPVQAVEDATGREDLVEALRNALLTAIAARLSCNRVARGDCASLAAVRTIAQSAKGAGFALPACIQHADAR